MEIKIQVYFPSKFLVSSFDKIQLSISGDFTPRFRKMGFFRTRICHLEAEFHNGCQSINPTA